MYWHLVQHALSYWCDVTHTHTPNETCVHAPGARGSTPCRPPTVRAHWDSRRGGAGCRPATRARRPRSASAAGPRSSTSSRLGGDVSTGVRVCCDVTRDASVPLAAVYPVRLLRALSQRLSVCPCSCWLSYRVTSPVRCKIVLIHWKNTHVHKTRPTWQPKFSMHMHPHTQLGLHVFHMYITDVGKGSGFLLFNNI